MPIKFNQIDTSSKKIRNILVAASGAIGAAKTGDIKSSYANSSTTRVPITKAAQFAGAGANVTWTQPMFFSPLHTPQNWQIASKRREVYQWSRFYYENEPKVAAAVDFYANFPMNGFKLEGKNRKNVRFFEKVAKDLRLNHWLGLISHEYFLLGDVFLWIEVDCNQCGGGGFTSGGEPCNHPGGNIKRITVLNPDWIEVQKSVLSSESVIALVPDEDLRMIVQRKKPEKLYRRLPKNVIDMVAAGQPIELSNRCVSHLKHNASPYGVYGTSMLRRLFTQLAYKTKLMTANWIVAERLVLPVRVVKIGDEKRPATPEDIADVATQLAAVANDPNLTLITHHAFDYEWYGATGKIHNITGELEQIGKEILDGMMLNQSLLNGEGPAYGSAQVGVEAMIRRLEGWRTALAEWVEMHVFLPIAMMQGFVDEEESEVVGETVYLYPKIKWNDLNIRDNSNRLQMLLQLNDKGLVSNDTLLKEFDLNYDDEVRKIRYETTMVGAQGQMGGPGGGAMGGMGGMDMGGMMGGGAPPGGDMGMGGEMPGAPQMGELGGGMGGAPGGDMGAPAGGGLAASTPDFKVTKKGKGGNDMMDQMQKQQEAQNVRVPLALTSLEQKMLGILEGIEIPFTLYAQYKVNTPGQQYPFSIDFAFPSIGVGVEADGAEWHDHAEQIVRDQDRDLKLATVGWRILRFDEDAIEERPTDIAKVIVQHIADASKSRKKRMKAAEGNPEMAKFASVEEVFAKADPSKIVINKQLLESGLGYVYLIGIAE